MLFTKLVKKAYLIRYGICRLRSHIAALPCTVLSVIFGNVCINTPADVKTDVKPETAAAVFAP